MRLRLPIQYSRSAALCWTASLVVTGLIVTAWVLDSVDRRRGCEAFTQFSEGGHHSKQWTPEVQFVEVAGNPLISVRAACCIESAARHHPNSHVTIHHVAPLVRDSILDTLITALPNFRLRELNLTRLFRSTPLNQWHKEGRYLRSWYPTEKLSDAARYALLWHRGGIYLDTDVIVLRSMRHLQDAVGLENVYGVNGAVLVFQRRSHHLTQLMEQLLEEWSDVRWGTEGPILLTKFLKRTCSSGDATAIQHRSDISNQSGADSKFQKRNSVHFLFNYALDPASCGGVTILPYHSFYPVPWPLWPTFYSVVNDWRHLLGCSYTVHLWNSMSKARHSAVGSRELLDVLASRNCPAVYEAMLKEGVNF